MTTIEDFKAQVDEALNCAIEHLEGVHQGKIVMEGGHFDYLYEAASILSQIIAKMPGEQSEEPNFDDPSDFFMAIGHNKLRQHIMSIIERGVK